MLHFETSTFLKASFTLIDYLRLFSKFSGVIVGSPNLLASRFGHASNQYHVLVRDQKNNFAPMPLRRGTDTVRTVDITRLIHRQEAPGPIPWQGRDTERIASEQQSGGKVVFLFRLDCSSGGRFARVKNPFYLSVSPSPGRVCFICSDT